MAAAMTAPVPIPVSVVVMTRDESANIAACLRSLDAFAEVFVVDSGSADGTAAIARALGATVVPFAWNGRYPKKKQWCLDTLPFRHDWVLFVDADERVTPELAAELAALLGPEAPPPPAAAYFLRSRPVVLGRVLRFGVAYRKIALLRRGRARFPDCPDLDVAEMWEVEGHYQPALDGPAGRLSAALLHDDLKPPCAWFTRHARYAAWEARLDLEPWRRAALLAAEGPWRRRLKRIAGRLPLRPVLAFLHAYVLRLGLLDGLPGLHHAAGRAFYYWQVSYHRAWLARRGRAVGELPQPVSSTSPASAFTSSNARRRTDSSGMR